MKKFALLSLISAPAFAHQTTFDEKAFLQLSGNDPARARAIKVDCQSDSMSFESCAKRFGGAGNLAGEAALKCEMDRLKDLPRYGNSNEPAGSRSDLVFGNVWHEDVRNGHSHAYSESRRRAAANEAFDRRLTQINNENASFKGTTSKTSGTEMAGGFVAGIPDAFTVNFNFGGNNSKTITMSSITSSQIEDLKRAYVEGWNDPSRWGSEPDVVLGPDKKIITGPTPSPKKTIEQIKAEKKAKTENKKGADNPPKHDDDEDTRDTPEINHHDVGTWAGNDTPRDVNGPMIATPIERDAGYKSPMESCIEDAVDSLIKQIGSGTVDPNSSLDQKENAERFKSVTEFGYCNEALMGHEFCAQKNFKESSTSAVDVQAERNEQFEEAMNDLLSKGKCDAYILGSEICKKAEEKWLVNPIEGSPESFENFGPEDFAPENPEVTWIPKKVTPGVIRKFDN